MLLLLVLLVLLVLDLQQSPSMLPLCLVCTQRLLRGKLQMNKVDLTGTLASAVRSI